MSRRRAVKRVDRQVASAPAILRSREPSGMEITASVTGQTAPERRRVPPTKERSQPVHVAMSHAAARIRVPSPLQAYTSIPRVSAMRCVSPVSITRT